MIEKIKRYLGIDYGEKFIGFARGQNLTNTASRWKVLRNNPDIIQQISQLLLDYKADELIIGLPVDAKGKALFTTGLVEKFALKLKKEFNLPIHFVDERYTTRDILDGQKSTNKKNKGKLVRNDAISAELILQQFLTEK